MNYLILAVQVTVATVVYALIYRWYIAPRLAGLPLLVALQPLLLVQAFRFTGLTLAVDGTGRSRGPLGSAPASRAR